MFLCVDVDITAWGKIKVWLKTIRRFTDKHYALLAQLYFQVKEICWNRTAEVLAIWIEDLKDPGGTAEEKSLSYGLLTL